VRFQGGDGAVLVPDDGRKYTLQFGNDGRVAARLDCNRGSGTWKETGAGSLELGPMALTRAACPPGSMHDHLARQWPSIRSYLIRDGRLYLALMADGGIYEFMPMTAPASTSTATLTNTYWKLMTLEGGAVTVPPEAREVHLILQLAQQRVTGFSGCNRLMGGYQLDGDRLSFSQLAGTMMACAPESMDTERRFHAMLQQVARWRVDGEKLDLLDASGATLAQFESRYMQ
jgi:heat shock protein HslJ